MNKDREIFKGLDEVLDGAGNRFGPILLDELQERLSKTVTIFDLELREILETSFKNYHLRKDQLKILLNHNFRNEENVIKVSRASVNSDIPEFIKKFDEKFSN